MCEKIDFVITWVDGADPDWRKEMAFWKEKETGEKEDASVIRYRDWDTLRYWFRGVEAYAPWVNRVHLLTWGHVPQWLNTECPRLHVVNHKDFIPQKYLPTFSSHPIELNMHRIPGLSEHFVYFNDDFFLTAPVKPEDFFREDLPCDSLEEMPLDLCSCSQMNYINANDIAFLNEYYLRTDCRKKFPQKWFSLSDPLTAAKNLMFCSLGRKRFFGLNFHHLPRAYRKQIFEEVWEQGGEWLDRTCSHKFRNDHDISPHAIKFWQLATGQFYPCSKRKYGCWFHGGQDPRLPAEAIRQKKYPCICYNDSDQIDFESAKSILLEAFHSVLPEKSSFEK